MPLIMRMTTKTSDSKQASLTCVYLDARFHLEICQKWSISWSWSSLSTDRWFSFFLYLPYLFSSNWDEYRSMSRSRLELSSIKNRRKKKRLQIQHGCSLVNHHYHQWWQRLPLSLSLSLSLFVPHHHSSVCAIALFFSFSGSICLSDCCCVLLQHERCGVSLYKRYKSAYKRTRVDD